MTDMATVIMQLHAELDGTKRLHQEEISKLVAEVHRLRGLVMKAESASFDGLAGDGVCPWCDEDVLAGRAERKSKHAPFCPAFNEDGSVK